MDARRRDLRLTWDEVATRAGINRETLRHIRNGNGDIRPLSKTGIEDALEWVRGSVDTTLAGGEPATLVDAADRQALEREYQDPAVAELAERLALQERHMARLAQENSEMRRMLSQITGKDVPISGGEESKSDKPRQAM